MQLKRSEVKLEKTRWRGVDQEYQSGVEGEKRSGERE